MISTNVPLMPSPTLRPGPFAREGLYVMPMQCTYINFKTLCSFVINSLPTMPVQLLSERDNSLRLAEDETANGSDIINILIHYEDGQEEPEFQFRQEYEISKRACSSETVGKLLLYSNNPDLRDIPVPKGHFIHALFLTRRKKMELIGK
ncbi:UNVERIFIED_CONTAM: hypothetical protein NCL1_34540 [Trichonephila clavipes]